MQAVDTFTRPRANPYTGFGPLLAYKKAVHGSPLAAKALGMESFSKNNIALSYDAEHLRPVYGDKELPMPILVHNLPPFDYPVKTFGMETGHVVVSEDGVCTHFMPKDHVPEVEPGFNSNAEITPGLRY